MSCHYTPYHSAKELTSEHHAQASRTETNIKTGLRHMSRLRLAAYTGSHAYAK